MVCGSQIFSENLCNLATLYIQIFEDISRERVSVYGLSDIIYFNSIDTGLKLCKLAI